MESRTVLDHRLALQKDVDEKALRTIRLSMILLALLVSIARLMDPPGLAGADLATILSILLGLVLLLASVFVSLGVYLETEITLGVGWGHTAELFETPYSEREWLEVLLDEYTIWTQEAKIVNEANARWLGRAQTSMIVGVAYLLISMIGVLTPASAAAVFLGSSMIGGLALLLYYLVSKTEEES